MSILQRSHPTMVQSEDGRNGYHAISDIHDDFHVNMTYK
jgi:hypothetical protein